MEFGSSLSALLPQPRNRSANTTELDPLPYVFTKNKNVDSTAQRLNQPVNPNQSVNPVPVHKSSMPTVLSPSDIKAAAKSAALQVTKQIIQDDDEEEDDDEVVSSGNFFSIPDRSELMPVRNEPYYSTLFADQVTAPLPFSTEHTGYMSEHQQQQLLFQQEIFQPNLADAPLDFKKPSGPSKAVDGPSGSSSLEQRTDYGSQYYANYPEYGDATGPYYSDYYSSSSYNNNPSVVAEDQNMESCIDEEALRRLQGKRNRGREEINFLEIKGDDQLKGTQQWLTKSLTEEKNMKSFSKKKGEQPTGQQRRKHQITYLIHQAKERELELKNTWSENKLTRRQTQAKYGF